MSNRLLKCLTDLAGHTVNQECVAVISGLNSISRLMPAISDLLNKPCSIYFLIFFLYENDVYFECTENTTLS